MSTSDGKPCWFNEELPPPVAAEYAPKGEWSQIGDLKSYYVGPESSTKAIVLIYDAFGPSSQVIQGADRLSDHLQTLVIMPDFFKGQAPDPVNNREAWQEFRKTLGDVPSSVNILIDLVPTLKSRFPTVDSWGSFGLCWGGKVSVLAAIAKNSPFSASGQTHPGLLEAKDAQALTTPHLCMPSKDEPEEMVREYERILAEKGLGKVERFPSMFHGWMGARAQLANKDNLEEYQRGYSIAAKFFAEHL